MFFAYLRTTSTDPPGFFDACRRDREAAEPCTIGWVSSRLIELRGARQGAKLRGVRSLEITTQATTMTRPAPR